MLLTPAAAVCAETVNLSKQPSIRVHLFETSSTVYVKPSDKRRVLISSNAVAELPANTTSTLMILPGELRVETLHSVTTMPLPADPVIALEASSGTMEMSAPGARSRKYEGRIQIQPAKNRNFAVIAELPMESYLRGVVPAEIGADAPEQAKCAQAVAARSFAALGLIGRKHEGDNYHLCSLVHCQVYGGLSQATASSDAAVRATAGLALTFEGKPIAAFYAAMCGGHTENIGNAWPDRGSAPAYRNIARFDGPGGLPFDLTKEDDFRRWVTANPVSYCNPDKSHVPAWTARNFRWTREFSAEEVTSFVAKHKDIGRVLEIRPGRRGQSGRLTEAEFVGEKGQWRAGPELTIRRVFKPQLRSSAFTLETSGTVGRPERFIFHGGGSGHGVGMCQTGAMGMANAGKSFSEILAHYYPKARVERLY